MKFFRVFIIAPLFVSTLATTSEPCDNIPLPIKISVDECENDITDSNACKLLRGSEAEITMTFQPNKTSDNLHLYYIPIDSDKTIYFNEVYLQDVCEILVHDSCPLQIKEYTIKATFPVYFDLPYTWKYIKFGISGNEEPLVCAKVPIELVKDDASPK